MSKFCENCGTKTDATDKFCTSCGTSIHIEAPLNNVKEKIPEVRTTAVNANFEELTATNSEKDLYQPQVESTFTPNTSSSTSAPPNRRLAWVIGGVAFILICIIVAISTSHNIPTSSTLASTDSTSALTTTIGGPFTPENSLPILASSIGIRTTPDSLGPGLYNLNSSVLWYGGSPATSVLFYPTAAELQADFSNLQNEQGNNSATYCQNLWVSYSTESASEVEQAINHLLSQLGVSDCGPILDATSDPSATDSSNDGSSSGTSDTSPPDPEQPGATGSIG